MAKRQAALRWPAGRRRATTTEDAAVRPGSRLQRALIIYTGGRESRGGLGSLKRPAGSGRMGNGSEETHVYFCAGRHDGPRTPRREESIRTAAGPPAARRAPAGHSAAVRPPARPGGCRLRGTDPSKYRNRTPARTSDGPKWKFSLNRGGREDAARCVCIPRSDVRRDSGA